MWKPRVGIAIFLFFCAGASLPNAFADSATTPLGQARLLALAAGNALPENVIHEIGTDGLAFHPDDAYRSLLTNAGADPKILEALASAKVTVATGSKDAADDGLLQHLSNAGRLLKAKQYDDAARELSAVLQSTVRSPEAGFVMGEVLRQTEQWGAAQSVYEEVLNEVPDFPEAHTKLSYILYHTGDQEEGLRQARAALALNPNNAEAHKNAGLALDATRRYDAAFAEYNEALRLKPDYEVVY